MTTFNSLIRINRRANPTNDGSSALLADDNGVVPCVQTIQFINNNPVNYAIPRGSLLLRAFVYYTTTTADSAATFTLTLATTPAISLTSAALGAGNRRVDLSFATLGANAANIGLADLNGTILTTSSAGPQQGTYVIEYLVRNADGSTIAYGQGLTNDGTGSPTF